MVGSGLIAWAGPLDRPRARGLHEGAVATSGGVAIVAGVSAGLELWASGRAGTAPGLAACLVLAGAMGLLGAIDDLRDLGARFKLLIQAIAALAFAIAVARIEAIPLTATSGVRLGPLFGALGTALWIVVVSNGLNFMDGANGLAAGAIAIAGAAFGVAAVISGAPDLGAAALIAAGGAAGFLPWNLSGRLFQGDVGALFSSVLLACLAVLGASSSGGAGVPIWTAPLALLPLLTDVLLTLLVRARRRRPLLDAHREHLYQLWLQHTGKPHAALAWRVYLIQGVYGAGAIGLARLPLESQSLAFATAVVLSATAWFALRSRYEAAP